MITNQRNQLGWTTLLAGAAVFLCVQASGWSAPVTIGFASQTNSGAAFVSDTESGFTVTPTTGSFSQTLFGDPAPSIYTSSSSAVEITNAGGLFNFSSTEFSSQNGITAYFIFGFNGGTLIFQESGTVPNSGNLGGFATYAATTADASKGITTLDISLTPGTGTRSVNIDDIKVNAVPEPVTTALVTMGGFALLGCRRWRRGVA